MRATLTPIPDLRKDLIRQVDEFCELAEKARKRAFAAQKKYPPWTQWSSKSAIGMEIAGDPGLFFRIEKGQNITLTTYERIRKWFEKHWPKEEP